MTAPYLVSTLLYCFDADDQVLLMERAQEPNLGCWSPCGGKLQMDQGESPHACARREAEEELGVVAEAGDLHLTGLVSEQGDAHWLMFLFELKPRLACTPPPHREGRFQFFTQNKIAQLALPRTDREKIWPLFWKHRRGFFAAHCVCRPDGSQQWEILESRPKCGLPGDV